tara:strand:- start:32 stop:430 length:399 start_codon:yes stop_codon:yes gene_type:complete
MKLNKTTLRDIIHEILMEQMEPPNFKIAKTNFERQKIALGALEKMENKIEYAALLQWINSLTPNVRGSDKALILKAAAAAADKASPGADQPADDQGAATQGQAVGGPPVPPAAAGTETALDEQLHRLIRRRK